MKVRSSRRAGGLKPDDYDHEIDIVDHDASRQLRNEQHFEPQVSRTTTTSRLLSVGEDGYVSGQDLSSIDSPQRLGSYADGAHDTRPEQSALEAECEQQSQIEHSDSRPTIGIQAPTPAPDDHNAKKRRPREKRETAIDILYENERGGFICGTAMFSPKLLGGLDPTPWTNEFHKPSLTNVHTAQLPDPSWEWISSEWTIHHQEGRDEFGWEYSFAFSKQFSWHSAKWWNSFVRRRAWVRRRAKKKPEDISADPHMLNTDYFSIRPASERTRQSAGSLGSRVPSKSSMTAASSLGDADNRDIDDLVTLMQVLRVSRIDREKREAMDNYLEHATDLEGLQGEMHEIMSLFIFQASRRLLLCKLIEKHNDTTAELRKKDSAELQQRKDALDAAVRHADEEVRRLAYWSDVKHMVANGETRISLEDERGCFYDAYQGADDSGPPPPNKGKLPGL